MTITTTTASLMGFSSTIGVRIYRINADKYCAIILNDSCSESIYHEDIEVLSDKVLEYIWTLYGENVRIEQDEISELRYNVVVTGSK